MPESILHEMSCFNPYSPGFSIYFRKRYNTRNEQTCFNPYSPGFSIYLEDSSLDEGVEMVLQSLFTWIFYLFLQFRI